VNCRSCQAPIFWTVTEAGKSMPVDAQPSLQGNLIVSYDDKGAHSRVAKGTDRAGLRYTSHFATCLFPPARSGGKR
jgi:hypothetical protein